MALPLFEIDSFLPVINQLSNVCCFMDKLLHIRGPISKADLEALFCYTRRVGTFILTDSSPALQGRTISSGTYIRLAQLNTLDTSFFPSLKHLRIVGDANSSLMPINLLLSNSLRSIELLNINHTQEEVLSSYLATLADECPELKSIKVVSPLSASVWENCFKFSHLRALELKDVFSDLDSSLFMTIGQALPQLEIFILDARTAKYRRAGQVERGYNLSESLAQAHISLSVVELSELYSDGRDPPESISPQSESMDSPLCPEPAFLHLEKLHITGGLSLIQDLVESIPSPYLQEIGLTLVRSERPKFRIGKSERIDLETPIFVTCLTKVLRTWRNSLANIFIGQYEHYPGPGPALRPVYPTLPVTVLTRIWLQPMLNCLDISGWTIESFLDSGYSSPFYKNPIVFSSLKSLHLPVESINEGLSLSSLRFIAESFPNLVSFQSRIVALDGDEIPVYDPSKAAANILSHGLETLSVGSAFLSPDLEELLDVARHIFALFPKLKEIQTHEGQNKSQWDYIHSIVRAFQGVCLDHTARLSLERII